MHAVEQHQASWRQALLTPDWDALPQHHASADHPALLVHRNNFYHATTESLRAVFPTTECLVGVDFFAAMARQFICQHPPTSPVMSEYGDGFANFVKSFEPAKSLVYLPDMCAFEWALHTLSGAPDCEPLSADDFRAIPADRLAQQRFRIGSNAQLFTSAFAIEDIWRAHRQQAQDMAAIGPIDRQSFCLIIRRSQGFRLLTLTESRFDLLETLHQGAFLAEAIGHALERDADFAVAENMKWLAEIGCLCANDTDAGAKQSAQQGASK